MSGVELSGVRAGRGVHLASTERGGMSVQLIRSRCPRCGRKLVYREHKAFRWRICPAQRRCGWTVFNHGDNPKDKEGR